MVECVICAKTKPPGAFHKMECCNQKYCRECIGDQAIQELSSCMLLNNITFQCPTASCKSKLTTDYLHSLKLPNWESIDRLLLKKYFAEHHDVKICPKLGCEYAVISSSRCSYLCEICKSRWSDIIYTKSHPAIIEIGNAVTFIEKAVIGEQCPNCGVYIFKNGGCPHMVCNLCKYEFCWHCLQDFNGYKHSVGGNICAVRMLSIIFFYLMFLFCLCSKLMTKNSFVKDIITYVGTGIINFALSAFYVMTHGFWIGWIENYSRNRYANNTMCLLFCLPILIIYEIVLNYIWYKYSLYVVLFQCAKVALLVLENGILIFLEDNCRTHRGGIGFMHIISGIAPSILMFILVFAGPVTLANQMVLLMPLLIATVGSYSRYDKERPPFKVMRWTSYMIALFAIAYFRHWRQIVIVSTFWISHNMYLRYDK